MITRSQRAFLEVTFLVILLGFACGAQAELRPIDDSHNARTLFDAAEALVLQGRTDEAVEKYRAVVRNYRDDPLAPDAQLRIADIQSGARQYVEAFDDYQLLIDRFPASPLFSRALAGQLQTAGRLIERQRQLQTRPNADQKRKLPEIATAIAMLRTVIRNGKFSAQAPEAQYRLAVVLDGEQAPGEALREHGTFLENYPDHPLADDAAFQIGMIHYRRGRNSNHERGAMEQARLALESFVHAQPHSEKKPEAVYMLATITQWEYQRLKNVGAFYQRTGKADAAVRSYKAAAALNPGDGNQSRARQEMTALPPKVSAVPPEAGAGVVPPLQREKVGLPVVQTTSPPVAEEPLPAAAGEDPLGLPRLEDLEQHPSASPPLPK